MLTLTTEFGNSEFALRDATPEHNLVAVKIVYPTENSNFHTNTIPINTDEYQRIEKNSNQIPFIFEYAFMIVMVPILRRKGKNK